MKSKTAIIIDSIFLNIILSIACIIWLRQYLNFADSLLCAICITVSINGLIRIRRKNKKKDTLTKQEKKHLEDCFFYFSLCDNPSLMRFFIPLFQNYQSQLTNDKVKQNDSENSDNQNADKTQKYSINHIEHTDNIFIINYTMYIIDLSIVKLDITTITNYIKAYFAKNCSILTLITQNNITQESKTLLDLSISNYKVLNKDKVYLIMKQQLNFPNITINKLKTKKSKLSILTILFSPINIRKYLIASVILMIYSYFSGTNLYYLIFSFICLTFAIICKINQLIKAQ